MRPVGMLAASRLSLASLIAAAALAIASPAGAQGADSAEIDTYRFGGTFARLDAASPAMCAALCTEDNRCEAWSHAPQRIDAAPQCELKRTQGQTENRPGYTSGIAGFHQVGALREEVGTVVRTERRNTAGTAIRDRSQVFHEGYRPVSHGFEVEELLGAGGNAKPAAAPRPTSVPKPVPLDADPYAPMQIVQSRPSVGKYGGTASFGGYGTSSSGNTGYNSNARTTVPPSYSPNSQGSGGQVIQARPTSNARDPSFYTED